MKFWVCVNNEISGPFEPADAVKVPGFTLFAWACRDKSGDGRTDEPRAWKRAISFPEMAACFFPNYPPPPAFEESAAPGRAPLSSGPAQAVPPVPPEPPGQRMALEPDSALMREINRKLDDLLARRGAAQQPPAAGEPLVKELRRTELIMAKLASGSGQALHKELEPLSRKLDLAEKTFSEMKTGLGKEELRLEIEPLTRTLAVTEKAVEDIRRDMESRDISGGLGPLKAEVEQAERAIEAEDARIALFREEVVGRLSSLETSLKDFRVELAAGRAVAEAEALLRQPPAQAGKSALIPTLAAVLAAALLGTLAFFRHSPAPARGTPALAAASVPAVPEPLPPEKLPVSELDFAKTYRVSAGGLTLSGAIERDAAGRGGSSGGASWEPEKVSDSYYRLLVSVPLVGAPGSLRYYFGLYPGEGRVRALNKAGRRALDLLAAPGPEKL